ncbi:MAG: GNAT family N-acetyltransferase [Candidatus Altiarchaeota archaeon]|nr:GNAT family N-acetyltransferase [Candidatus Altiarchaeota archaeon]
MIRNAVKDDVKSISDLHSKCIYTGFLTSLGNKFLELFYCAFIETKSSEILVYESDGEIVGFVSCSTNLKDILKYIILHELHTLFFAVKHKLLDWKIYRNVIEDILYFRKTKYRVNSAELVSICARDDMRGNGIGSALVEEMIGKLKKQGVESVATLVSDDLQESKGFYEKNGFRLTGKIKLHNNKESSVYTYKIKRQ